MALINLPRVYNYLLLAGNCLGRGPPPPVVAAPHLFYHDETKAGEISSPFVFYKLEIRDRKVLNKVFKYEVKTSRNVHLRSA